MPSPALTTDSIPTAIPAAYARNLRYSVGRASALPYPKETIHAASRQLLTTAREVNRHRLETAYINLELFVSDQEYAVVRDFEDAARMVPSAIEKADATAIREMVLMIEAAPASEAEEIQDRVTERMVARAKELGRVGEG